MNDRIELKQLLTEEDQTRAEQGGGVIRWSLKM